MNDIEQKILSDYAVALAKWQVELYQGRQTRMDNPFSVTLIQHQQEILLHG